MKRISIRSFCAVGVPLPYSQMSIRVYAQYESKHTGLYGSGGGIGMAPKWNEDKKTANDNDNEWMWCRF